MLKLNRGVLATSLILSLATAPITTVQAVSDEVAVQLLERLSELELEISNLRGENEMLRQELTDVRSAQREGFLEVDERVSGLEKKRRLLPQSGDTSSDTAGSGNTNGAQNALGADTSVPALEAPVATAEALPLPTPGTIVATPTPIRVDPEIAAVAVVTENDPAIQTTPQLADENTASQRQATAPVTAEKTVAATDKDKVDPSSPDSYYYYGTQDRNTDSVTEINTSKASLAADKPQTIPDAHKAKAAYNQAYKSLVNDPKSAVPAFRAFMKNYPEHELVANAQYWLGEALYAQKDYSGATEEFMRVLKQHKESPKAPGAALKLGYSFYELRQWDFARRTLEDTVRFFPDTNAAKLASNRLERMKAEGK